MTNQTFTTRSNARRNALSKGMVESEIEIVPVKSKDGVRFGWTKKPAHKTVDEQPVKADTNAPKAKKDAVVKPTVVTPREQRNGVKRPLDPTGKCGQVWAALDELVAKGETDLTAAIHAIAEKRKWSKSNVSCELSAFRRYHGISTNREVSKKRAA
jgi:hypothetical protein